MVNSEAKSWAAQLPQSLTKNKNALAYFETARLGQGRHMRRFGYGRHQAVRNRGGELPLQRHAARRRGLGGNLLGGRNGQAGGLNPRKYLEWLLEEMPNAADLGDPAYLDSLMPWSDSVPEEIRLKPEAAAEAAKMADDPIIDIDPSAFSEDGE